MKKVLFVLLFCVFGNVSDISFAENVNGDVSAVNDIKKDAENQKDIKLDDNASASVKTDNLVLTNANNENVNANVGNNTNDGNEIDTSNNNIKETNNTQVYEMKNEVNIQSSNGKNVKMNNQSNRNENIGTNISANQIRMIDVNNKSDIRAYNVGIDLYFSTSQSTFSTITGVDSYKVGNRVYTFGINANFSWKLQSDLHMFTGFGFKYDWFNKYSSGVIGSKMSPSIGFYGMFGMKIIFSKYFSVEPYIHLGAILLGNGKVQYGYSYSYYSYYHSYRYGPRRSMNVVGMMTALGVDFVFFKVLTLGVQLQYNMFSCEKFNGALIGLGHEARLLNQQRWQHHIAIAGKIGLKFDSLYLSM